MSISRSVKSASWAQPLIRGATTPVFPQLPTRGRPYLLAFTLFAAAGAAMFAGDAALLRYGLPWTLVSLLVIVAAANLWGTRSALLVLALAALYGVFVVPHQSIGPSLGTYAATASPERLPPPGAQALLLRTLFFLLCGATTIYLTDRARKLQATAELRREVVTALQTLILPDKLATAPGYDLSGVYRPAHREQEVGGDFYDFYPLGAGRYGLLIGDVMGKGKEAAVSTSLLRYSVRAFTSAGSGPAETLRRLNDLIDTQEQDFAMATLFLGILDTQTSALRYANAGHEPPLRRRQNGTDDDLQVTGPVLGTHLDITYDEALLPLALGDTLLLMTDGVTEARNDRREFLGREGAAALLHAALNASTTHQALATFDTALTAYINGNRCDDIAILLLRREG